MKFRTPCMLRGKTFSMTQKPNLEKFESYTKRFLKNIKIYLDDKIYEDGPCEISFLLLQWESQRQISNTNQGL